MLTVQLNDNSITINEGATLQDLLHHHGYRHQGFAVALNHHFLPRSLHETTILNNHDIIDIITPMQGG